MCIETFFFLFSIKFLSPFPKAETCCYGSAQSFRFTLPQKLMKALRLSLSIFYMFLKVTDSNKPFLLKPCNLLMNPIKIQYA